MANAVRNGLSEIRSVPIRLRSNHLHRNVARALGRISGSRLKGQEVPRGCHDEILHSAVRLCNSRSDHSGPGSVGWHVARGALNDAHQGGISLSASSMRDVLHLGIDDPDVMRSLLQGFEALGLDRRGALNALANMAIANASSDQLLAVISEMRKIGVAPGIAVVDHFVRLAARGNMCRAALELADAFETSGVSSGRLDRDTWFALLVGSVRTSFAPGIRAALPRVLVNPDSGLDEGTWLSVLNTAARNSDIPLAVQAAEGLASNGIKGLEHHITPLLDAHLRRGDIGSALRLICSASTRGLAIHQRGLQPLVRALDSTALIDEALAHLEDIKIHDAHVPGLVLVSIMSASLRLGDMARTRTAHVLGRNWGVFTDVKAYNIVITACVASQDIVLGNKVFGEILTEGLQPDSETLGAMASLSVATGSYEDAFEFLEQINVKGWRAEESLYRDLYNICSERRDVRWQTVLAEAHSRGYNLMRTAHGHASKLG